MKYKLLIILIVLFQIPKIFAYDNSLRPNLLILDSLTNASTSEICSFLNNQKIDTFNLKLQSHPADWIVMQYLISKKNCPNLFFFKNDTSNRYIEIDIQINSLRVDYSLDSNASDSLYRTFKVNIKGYFINKNKQIIPVTNTEKIFSDKISRDDISFIENSSYPFATAPVPEAKRTFFEEVTEPLIVVSAAIISVVLLFTVRSH